MFQCFTRPHIFVSCWFDYSVLGNFIGLGQILKINLKAILTCHCTFWKYDSHWSLEKIILRTGWTKMSNFCLNIEPSNVCLILANFTLYTTGLLSFWLYLFFLISYNFFNCFDLASQQEAIKLFWWLTTCWNYFISSQNEVNFCQLDSLMCTLRKDVSQDYGSSKKNFSALVGRKCIVFFAKLSPIENYIYIFWKMHCNASMHCKIHFTDISQIMIWRKLVYYTKLELSWIYNPFSQTTYLHQIILLKIRRF